MQEESGEQEALSTKMSLLAVAHHNVAVEHEHCGNLQVCFHVSVPSPTHFSVPPNTGLRTVEESTDNRARVQAALAAYAEGMYIASHAGGPQCEFDIG